MPKVDADELPAEPDFAEFKRRAQSVALGGPWLGDLMRFAYAMSGDVGPGTPPEHVPWETIRAMGFDPVVKLGERIAIAPALDLETYFVRHPDPAVVAETEAWLWPVLQEMLLAILRAVAWGSMPVVYTWESADLGVETPPLKPGGKARRRTIRGHLHYTRADELWPGATTPIIDDRGDVEALDYYQARYGRDRAQLVLFDDEFGALTGNGSRRRAYRAWMSKCLERTWRGRYLERSVDPPRIGWAPVGKQKLDDGSTTTPVELLAHQLLMLKGGGAAVFPNTTMGRNGEGERAYAVDFLKLEDRSQVWHDALSYEDAEILLACLVPPSTVIAEEQEGLAGAKVAGDSFAVLTEMITRWAARVLTERVAIVHAYNHGDAVDPPEICARELPKQKRKLLLEVLKGILDVTRQLPDGRVFSLGELISTEILEQLGIPALQVDDVAHEPGQMESTAELVGAPPGQAKGGPVGRPKDATGGREERRDAASTDEGEDGTGAPDETARAQRTGWPSNRARTSPRRRPRAR